MTRSALLETPRFAILPAMPRVLPLLILCAAAHAAEVAQFRAENFGEEWRAARGGTTLSAVHPATNGWAAALGLSFPSAPDIAARLRALGVDSGSLYATILILR